ncbi:MAG: hypothetical protein ABFD29_03870 [Anaerolineaceae bacterium]
MIWNLEALKLLAKNQSVPGVALRDAISEIERLQSYLKVIENEAPNRNSDWCRRIAKEGLAGNQVVNVTKKS